ncbi:MAG: FtsQ-type POTRA domain-containing protein [Acidimicrobiales bacterium]
MSTSTPDDWGTAPIDPRIRARRIEVQRGAGRRRLQRVVDLGLVLTVAAGFAIALRSPALDVDVVDVQGATHTPADLVRDTAGIAPGDQLVDVDLRAAGERIATLPWVQQVDLHRGLDGRVEVRLTERTAVAVLGTGEAAVLVDAEGRVVARLEEAPDVAVGLVRLEGVTVTAAPGAYVGAGARDALALAARLAAVPGMAMELTIGDDLVGTLESGIDVRFGSVEQIDAKVRSLRTVLDQVDLTCAGVIDVRSPGSPVLTRDETCS